MPDAEHKPKVADGIRDRWFKLADAVTPFLTEMEVAVGVDRLKVADAIDYLMRCESWLRGDQEKPEVIPLRPFCREVYTECLQASGESPPVQGESNPESDVPVEQKKEFQSEDPAVQEMHDLITNCPLRLQKVDGTPNKSAIAKEIAEKHGRNHESLRTTFGRELRR